MKLKLTILGYDSWDRIVLKDEEGNLYKTYDDPSSPFTVLHTTDSYDGEPNMSLPMDIAISIMEESP